MSLHETWTGEQGGGRRRWLGVFVAIAVGVLLIVQASALVRESAAQEATCPGGATPQADYGGQLVCPETGTVIAGEVPTESTPGLGLGLIVFGGGTSQQLVEAVGCPMRSARFWVLDGGEFVVYIPASRVSSVNRGWFARFEGGIAPNTPLLASCRQPGLAMAVALPLAPPA